MSINTMSAITPAINDFMRALESHGVASTNVQAASVILDAYETGGSSNSNTVTNSGGNNNDNLGTNAGGSSAIGDLQSILTQDAGNSTSLGNDLQSWLQNDLGATSTAAAAAAPVLAALAPVLDQLFGISSGSAGNGGGGSVNNAGGSNNAGGTNNVSTNTQPSVNVSTPAGTQVSTSATYNGQPISTTSGGGTQLTGNVMQDLQTIAAESDPTMRQNDITNWLENDLGLPASEATELAPLLSSLAPALATALGGSTSTTNNNSVNNAGNSGGVNNAGNSGGSNNAGNNSGGANNAGNNSGGASNGGGGIGNSTGVQLTGNAMQDLQSIAAESNPTMRQNDITNWLENDLGLPASEATELAPLLSSLAPALATALGGSTSSNNNTNNTVTSTNVNNNTTTSTNTVTSTNTNNYNTNTSSATSFVPTGDAVDDFETFATQDAGNVSSLTQDATTWAEQDLQLSPSIAAAIAPELAAVAPALAQIFGGASTNTQSS